MPFGEIFSLSEERGDCGPYLVARLRKTDLLSPSLLADPRLEADFEPVFKKRDLHLYFHGRMPLWLASGLVHWLVSSGQPPKSLGVFEPRYARYIPVWPEQVCVDWVKETKRYKRLPEGSLNENALAEYEYSPAKDMSPSMYWPVSAGVVNVKVPRGEGLSLCELGRLASAVTTAISQPYPRMLILNGRMPLWLAAALAGFFAQLQPDLALALHAPQHGGFVVLKGTPTVPIGSVLSSNKTSAKKPLMVGIVGDPNHGKSVLSWKLYWKLGEIYRFGVYRLDADAYSPTPGWSLHPLTDQGLRGEYKRQRGPWTQQDHENLATTIDNLRRAALDLVLVDLPGGDHRKDPPLRIPPGREIVFERVDKFIVISCNGSCGARKACREGWHKALREMNLHGRIVGEVISVLEDGEKWPDTADENTDSTGTLPCWHISALRRDQVRKPTPAIDSLASFLQRLVQRGS